MKDRVRELMKEHCRAGERERERELVKVFKSWSECSRTVERTLKRECAWTLQ